MTGTSEQDAANGGWVNEVHPDDRSPLSEKWQASVQSGETLEIEYRLHDAARGYRWYLDRAVPLRDEKGVIRQWFGTCTDIEEQKHYQQLLEQQIKERTEELADTNTRLQQEMWEKDLARRTLDEHNEQMIQALKERSQRATLWPRWVSYCRAAKPARRFSRPRSVLRPEYSLPVAVPLACSIRPTILSKWQVSGTTASSRSHLSNRSPAGRCAPGIRIWFLLAITLPAVAMLQESSPLTCASRFWRRERLSEFFTFRQRIRNPSLGEAELSFNTTFAAQVGLSVANIRLREALRAQSTKDPLTGLYNRRYLQEMLDREIRRAIRSEQALGILMLDLDHFKKFNDTFGHEAGDAVLRETGSFLVRSIRAEDFVCRYGGEEFVVVLPTADLRAAEARAQRIRAKLRDLVIMHNGRSLGLITASIGVAALPHHGTGEKELLQAADAALYRAKREGRDRVAVADLTRPPDQQSDAARSGT
jgi:diguanylate cyclase (GGDEF)-like protein